MDEPPSSPPTESTAPEDALAYYKAQYEQLEHELAEFQSSSQELEAELEKDVEAAEERERALQQKAETLGFEVDEWKNKYKQSKNEAGAAQNTLQKEITTLRDSNRTLVMKLRDIEVANDDFERQARNTTSSLEDVESKYNVAIERAVMMEEEIKIGEQEREGLRIEAQRLRDELGDLKIEAEILQDKLKRHESRQLPILSTDITAPNTPSFAGEISPDSIASSPLITTPPDSKSVSTADTISETPTPPSPPISDRSSKAPKAFRTPLNPPSRIRAPSADLSVTPKPMRYPSSAQPLRSSRGPSIPASSKRPTPSVSLTASRPRTTQSKGLPNSASLTHIRSLTAQVQRLEQRVQSARSKLPAPVNTPPRASPRTTSAAGGYMPSSITIRSRKRTGGSTISATSSVNGGEETPNPTTRHVSRISTSGISRLSFGPVSNRGGSEFDGSRPSSRASTTGAPGGGFARPVSRTESNRPQSRTELSRPLSRTSMTGARTPLGHYSQSTLAESRRPRSSIGGNFGASVGHGHSQSVSQIDLDEYREFEFGTPNRRTTLGREDGSAIPVPASGLPRRQSGGLVAKTPGKRMSNGILRDGERELEKKRSDASLAGGGMKPPMRTRKLSGVGESY
ncbi:NADH:ubiquinone oxidoreductase [Pseudogymnoascus australis]